MTPADLASRWADLASGTRAASGLSRRRLDAEASVDVFACVFWPKGHSGLLIEGEGEVPELAARIPRCRGVRVLHDERSGEDGVRTALIVMLEEERLREIFAVLSADLVNAVVNEPVPAAALRRCLDRLSMWQGLFERISPEGLSIERQRGLFGELLVLEQLFLERLDPLAAVTAWCGSNAAHQDFLRGGLGVEVKASLAKRHARIQISNEKQLDERPHDRLILANVRLEESEGHGRSLPELVESLRRQLATDEQAARLFDEKLMDGDYLDVHAPLYEAHRYWPASIRYFHVEGEFPRLTEANLPPGVGDIGYSIIADDLGRWEIDQADVLSGNG